MQQQSATMDATTQAQWEKWCDGRINAALEDLAEIIGSETGKTTKELRGEISQLRGELAVLRSIVAGKTVKTGRKDVA